MCATVFYTKRIKGRLYPKAARTGPYAFAQEVSRVRGEVVTRYIGIMRVSKDARAIENGEVARSGESGVPSFGTIGGVVSSGEGLGLRGIPLNQRDDYDRWGHQPSMGETRGAGNPGSNPGDRTAIRAQAFFKLSGLD
ncbi:MAG: hypothetical protein LYZ66_01855 [Nitrososphaerales archaeon]|nr:hypothetical protein [Nitrososphaerales archaeon]